MPKGPNKRTYLWDMRLGVPDSVDLCSETVIPEVQARIPAGKEIHFNDGQVSIQFGKETLFDDLYLRMRPFQEEGFPGLAINDPYTYLWNSMQVQLYLPEFRGNKAQTQVYLLHDNGYKSFQGGDWDGNRIRFSTRNFGRFVLAKDSLPPSIRPVRVNSRGLRFVIRDDLSGIADFNAWVDGEWIQLRYEHKQSLIQSDPPAGKELKGDVLVKVRDRANNEAIYRGKI